MTDQIDLVEHYARMALNPATVQYAKQRVQELEDDPSGLWVGFYEKVKTRLNELKEQK